MQGSSTCYNHDPSRAEERRAHASKGGRTGGRGRPSTSSEIDAAKGWIRALITKLLKGEVERTTATACFMGLNVMARYLELERKVAEVEAFEERVAELEAIVAEQKNRGGRRSGW